MRKHAALASLAASLLLVFSPAALALGKPREEKPGVQLDKLRPAAGYTVSVFAQGMPKARQMAMGPDGTLYVGSYDRKLYALGTSGGKAVGPPRVILEGKASSGVAYSKGSLFVSDRDRILRYDNVRGTLAGAKPVEIVKGLPDKERHAARFMMAGADGKLYISVGSPCNVCEPKNDEYGTIIRVNPDGSGREVVARGIRNTVGFDWNPKDASLWFSDNGQDELGPDKPEDELNRVSKMGEHFGFPYCHGKDIADKAFTARTCAESTPPAVGLGAHTAALGMRFMKADGSAIIARHGSHPPLLVAYDVVRVKLDGSRASPPEPFLTGFLQGDHYWGRPADVLPLADGSVLVSDDLNGVIYRVAR